MSLEIGLIGAFAIIGFGGAALVALLIWLRKKDADQRREKRLHHA